MLMLYSTEQLSAVYNGGCKASLSFTTSAYRDKMVGKREMQHFSRQSFQCFMYAIGILYYQKMR